MKVVTKPTVYLVAEPKINWGVIAQILREQFSEAEWDFTSKSDAELIAEFMGRMCYKSFGKAQGRKDSAEYLQNIMGHGHGSVLEHPTFSFLVTGCSRAFTHQQVRHRVGWAYSQESQHFIKYSEEATICLPGYDNDPEALQIAIDGCKAAIESYCKLYERFRPSDDGKITGRLKKLAAGTCRSNLPNAVESKLGMTGNIRALRHCLELRGAEDNTIETRLVYEQIMYLVQESAPAVFADFSVRISEDDGYPVVYSDKYRKV